MVGSCNVVVVDEDVFCFQIWWRQEGLMLPVRWAWSSTLGRDFVKVEEGISFAMADSSVPYLGTFDGGEPGGFFLVL